MEHLTWFLAGSSLGVFIGVFVTCLARMAGDQKHERQLAQENLGSRTRLALVRR